ncbi:unnamed protein product [Litomosoides sigmodontis]|uniref:Homeobox domain-containing protein n=1 Tax=Litomosoides sigmodontis TaxID=42156 RepID=A0A3P7LYA0_LITSI|nr:unnamed protein product [Litomosoides sigmodontis]
MYWCTDEKPVTLANDQAITLSLADITPDILTITNNSSNNKDGNGNDNRKNDDICDRVYHENCVRCSVCSAPLRGKCFERNGNLYCRLHYYEKHSPNRCAGCQQGIAPTELIYKIKGDIFYHITCHQCIQCGRRISQGEQVCINEVAKSIACIAHAICNNDLVSISIPTTALCILEADRSNLLSEVVSRKLNSSTGFFAHSHETYEDEQSDESNFLKRRGPRTTIKQYQLDVLNRMFTSTPKPSKHLRAKLALETGLTMRVIQVWFQNRRSKERRLKHLCNYLRRFEQRGLIAPSIGSNSYRRISSNESITLQQLLSLPLEADEEGGEIFN